jgi:hypothetical protein
MQPQSQKRPIYILEDFSTEDLHTLDDCDEAEHILDEQIATIAHQLEDSERLKDEHWAYNARLALTLKKVGLRITQRRRSQLRRLYKESRDMQFINLVNAHHPDIAKTIRDQIA